MAPQSRAITTSHERDAFMMLKGNLVSVRRFGERRCGRAVFRKVGAPPFALPVLSSVSASALDGWVRQLPLQALFMSQLVRSTRAMCVCSAPASAVLHDLACFCFRPLSTPHQRKALDEPQQRAREETETAGADLIQRAFLFAHLTALTSLDARATCSRRWLVAAAAQRTDRITQQMQKKGERLWLACGGEANCFRPAARAQAARCCVCVWGRMETFGSGF